MTNEEIRIKVAEAMGARLWNNPTQSGPSQLWGFQVPSPSEVFARMWLCGEADCLLPDYPEDLNACHEMEKVFIGADKSPNYSQYRQQLYKVCNNSPELAIRATARQRAEAFLRTLNLWKD